ncbi:hypothetical protein D3C80_1806540 [compost metagenome]
MFALVEIGLPSMMMAVPKELFNALSPVATVLRVNEARLCNAGADTTLPGNNFNTSSILIA